MRVFGLVFLLLKENKKTVARFFFFFGVHSVRIDYTGQQPTRCWPYIPTSWGRTCLKRNQSGVILFLAKMLTLPVDGKVWSGYTCWSLPPWTEWKDLRMKTLLATYSWDVIQSAKWKENVFFFFFFLSLTSPSFFILFFSCLLPV